MVTCEWQTRHHEASIVMSSHRLVSQLHQGVILLLGYILRLGAVENLCRTSNICVGSIKHWNSVTREASNNKMWQIVCTLQISKSQKSRELHEELSQNRLLHDKIRYIGIDQVMLLAGESRQLSKATAPFAIWVASNAFHPQLLFCYNN